MPSRIFALSDIHVDYEANARWVQGLSRQDYRQDVLILAGDVSHRQALLRTSLQALVACFQQVLFVPGNHDLWVLGEPGRTSLDKFEEVQRTAAECGVQTAACRIGDTLLVPLLGWYDYSFGVPSEELLRTWADYRACRWPDLETAEVALLFERMNRLPARNDAKTVISCSHFLPRIDLVPSYVPARHRVLDPVLGSVRIEQQLRRLQPDIHVYGHSHINRSLKVDGVRYINNAYGYPQEDVIAAKRLLCIHETA